MLLIKLETGNFKRFFQPNKVDENIEEEKETKTIRKSCKIDLDHQIKANTNPNTNSNNCDNNNNIEESIQSLRKSNDLKSSYSDLIKDLSEHNSNSVHEIIEIEKSKQTNDLNKNILSNKQQNLNYKFNINDIKEEKANLISIKNKSIESSYPKAPIDNKCSIIKESPNKNLKDAKKIFVNERQEGITNSFKANETENSVKTELKSNHKMYSFNESNCTEQKSFYSRAYRDRIFWSNEKMEAVRMRLNLARSRLIELERKDFAEIYNLIDQNNMSVL